MYIGSSAGSLLQGEGQLVTQPSTSKVGGGRKVVQTPGILFSIRAKPYVISIFRVVLCWSC